MGGGVGGRQGGWGGGQSGIDAAPQREERSPSTASPFYARLLQSQRGVQLPTRADSMDGAQLLPPLLLPLLLLSGCLPKVSQLSIFAP